MTELDSFQRAFVEASLGMKEQEAIILKAVAGSGKTHSVLSSALEIIKGGFDPKKIVLTSFTNNSARELLNRYKKRKPEEVKDYANITTLHGLGRQVLNEQGSYVNHSIITEWTSILIMRGILEDKGMCPMVQSKQTLTAISRDILQSYSKARNNSLVPRNDLTKVGAYITDNYCDDIAEQDKLRAVMLYQAEKEKQRLLDYDDMLWLAVEHLKQDSEFLNQCRGLWKYFYIDEAQDLSQSQYDLVTLLAEPNKLIMVGDSCQSIYGFRDARPENFSEAYLSQFFKSVTRLDLKNNYRSEKSIVKVGNLARLVANDDIEAIPHKQDPISAVKIVKAPNNILEGRYITDTISKLLLDGYSPKDIVVICRSNRYIKTVVEPAFVNANLKYKFSGSNAGKRLTERDLVVFYVSALSVYINNQNRTEWINLLSTCKGFGVKTVAEIRLQMISRELYDFNGLGYAVKEEFKPLMELLRSDVNYTNPYELVQTLRDLSEELCLNSVLKDDKNQENIYTTICNYISLQKSLRPEATNREVIQSVITEISEYSGDNSEDCITLATVHSQKGCESKVTFCCGFNTLREANTDPEEANILYVQISRAIEKLFIIDSEYYLTKQGDMKDSYKNLYFEKLLDLIKSK